VRERSSRISSGWSRVSKPKRAPDRRIASRRVASRCVASRRSIRPMAAGVDALRGMSSSFPTTTGTSPAGALLRKERKSFAFHKTKYNHYQTILQSRPTIAAAHRTTKFIVIRRFSCIDAKNQKTLAVANRSFGLYPYRTFPLSSSTDYISQSPEGLSLQAIQTFNFVYCSDTVISNTLIVHFTYLLTYLLT